MEIASFWSVNHCGECSLRMARLSVERPSGLTSCCMSTPDWIGESSVSAPVRIGEPRTIGSGRAYGPAACSGSISVPHAPPMC
jgi:hypothetical protein